MRFTVFLPALFLLTACAGPSMDEPHPFAPYLVHHDLGTPRPDDFLHCRGYGCVIKDRVSLNEKEWAGVQKLFKGAKTASAERESVSKAIGLLERIVGPMTSTENDVGGTFRHTGEDQMDCVDESTNTTVYLGMMQNDRLLKFHTVNQPVSRSPFTTMHAGKFWPHFTAVMVETRTGEAWAVDSWARDNGFPAEILPLNDWSNGAGLSEAEGARFHR
jgi:hypothetical protein